MKALKSDLAKAVLADPKARTQLREYLVTHQASRAGGATVVIEVENKGTKRAVTPVVVPKAA